MAEWLVEQGIGEERAILTDGSRIIATRLHWPGELMAGHVVSGRLIHRTGGSKRGTTMLDDGREVLLDKLPVEATEGSDISIEITRGVIGERGRAKLANGRITETAPCQPSLFEMLQNEGERPRVVRSFPAVGWNDIIGDALIRTIAFDGGQLLIDPTPAMVVIDVDGSGNALQTALVASPAIADAIQRFEIGGVIGVDFLTIPQKADRRKVDGALAKALSDWPHERTAMNGFGFVQIVARSRGPSLIHRATYSRTAMLARHLLRRAERVADPGAILLTIHPAIRAKLKPEWLDKLARRTGRDIRIETNPALALEGGFAQAVAR